MLRPHPFINIPVLLPRKNANYFASRREKLKAKASASTRLAGADCLPALFSPQGEVWSLLTASGGFSLLPVAHRD